MHRGPYSEEGSTFEKIHKFIKDNGGTFEGHNQKHHEIYLSDPNLIYFLFFYNILEFLQYRILAKLILFYLI